MKSSKWKTGVNNPTNTFTTYETLSHVPWLHQCQSSISGTSKGSTDQGMIGVDMPGHIKMEWGQKWFMLGSHHKDCREDMGAGDVCDKVYGQAQPGVLILEVFTGSWGQNSASALLFFEPGR